MRRKLINQETYEKMANNSLTAAETELVQAEGIIAKVIGKDQLSLNSLTSSTVLYETLDDTYIHAGYEIKNNQITLSNIEELVVDQASKRSKMKGILGEMIDSILVNNNNKAEQFFNNYMELYSWNEAKKFIKEKAKDDNKGKKMPPWLKDKKDKKPGKKGKDVGFLKKVKGAGKKIEEAYKVASNVLDYVEYMNIGPTLAEAVTKKDDQKNVTDLRIPVSKVRNEGKMLQFDWKTLKHEVKTLREQALSLFEDENFCKAMESLKKQDNARNGTALESVLDDIVTAWPQVLYTTQNELAQVIGEALRVVGATNYDDMTCANMAEGILITAHGAHEKRADQILHLASAAKCSDCDQYRHFQNVVEQFYPSIDEKFGLERKIFEDLYESFDYIYRNADRRGDEALKQHSADYINELADVLNGREKADIGLAEEAADWLASLIETNLESGVWTVSNTPHITVSGDHPDMAKKAGHSYSPSKDFSGNWGDEAPMIGQDDMNYKGGKHSKQARSNSWGNVGGGDVFPGLANPYIPKPFGDYTMKGEPGVDKTAFGQHHSTWQSKDTWPTLQNPYVPKHETPQTYKMNKGKEKDLVVDK